MVNASSFSSAVSTSSWLLDLGRATTSSPWLSTDWLASRKAIPLYILAVLWLLQRLPWLLERFLTPREIGAISAWVVPAETRHARFLPVQSQHAFRYNTLYLALRLDKLEARKLDTGCAFAWKGAVLQPEFVDQAALADRRGVTPVGARVGASQSNAQDWKAKMRAAERIERRRLEEKRTRNERSTWSLTGLHPGGYLRTHIPVSAPTVIPSADETQEEQGTASRTASTGMTPEKAAWISGSILLKLAYELRERGFLSTGPQDADTAAGNDWRRELGHVWTVTMPSIVGLAGINPLTVHYCYRPHNFNPSRSNQSAAGEDKEKRGAFWLVVLEVHNTFSERHIYVLEAGKNEDGRKDSTDGEMETQRRGYDHQWTFARSFHVSPFNDRGGYYRLFLKEPFAEAGETGVFVLGIRLLLLVEAEDAPNKLIKKLMAKLDSVSPARQTAKEGVYVGRCVRPLSSSTLYAALLRQPADLFLTFSRILWQAGKLHFSKRLDAFGRPDMVQLSETGLSPSEDEASAQAGYDGVGLPPPLNRIQPHRQQQQAPANDASVGLAYPKAGWVDKVAKEYVHSLFARRVEELQSEKGEKWTVTVVSTDPADPGIHIRSSRATGGDEDEKQRKLVLYTRSYGVYVDLMTYKPARLALLLGSVVGRRWGVSSKSDFDDFFGTDPWAMPAAGDPIRKRHFDFLLHSYLRSGPHRDRNKALKVLQAYGATTATTAPDSSRLAGARMGEGWKVKLALWFGYMAAVAEKNAFEWLGARYVQGTEPWLELERALTYLEAEETGTGGPSWDTRLGSVYHPPCTDVGPL